MRKHKGFTMAELMVAMAVIGILVAIVTPAVMRNRPSKDKMMVKKTFYTAENIVSSLINDERLYPDRTDGCYDAEDAGTECFWGFDDLTAITYNGIEFKEGDKFADLFIEKLNVRVPPASSTDHTVTTNDGVNWDLENAVGAAVFNDKTTFDVADIIAFFAVYAILTGKRNIFLC